jgi:hypothetical protein
VSKWQETAVQMAASVPKNMDQSGNRSSYDGSTNGGHGSSDCGDVSSRGGNGRGGGIIIMIIIIIRV